MKKSMLNSKMVVVVEDSDIGKGSGIRGHMIDVLVCTQKQWSDEHLKACLVPCLNKDSTVLFV